ncbi:protein TonB [Inhella inkyongensis]|uniref:Protein TonB n=1 Tax=Inhella inkyongensis TaxID=392593 RepID=A0A840S3T7_9BURK|nr:TonB family protein [Inhella inkyongensis]MBB5203494.1 protein TonB [Inhella inkyongensis]
MILARDNPLHVAVVASAALHLGILFVQLATPGSAPRAWVEERLEVILVNAQGERSPTKAQALAQAKLAGGGQGAPNERAQSPLPPSPEMELGDALQPEHRRQVQQLRQQQQLLLTQARRELAKMPPPDPEREAATPEGKAQAERRRQLLALLAEIERRVNQDNSGPRQRFVSPATQEVVYARYYDALRRRIEARGTRDFPTQGGRRLYGQLTMTLSVNAEGRLVDMEIVQSSGNALLDRRAAAIVQACAPFGKFSPEMRQEAEVLVVSARFSFDRDHGLAATLDAPAP